MPDKPLGSTGNLVVMDEKTFPESYVKELRDENARRRVSEKEMKDKLDEVSGELTGFKDSLGKALGLKPNETPTDPLQSVLQKLTGLETDLAKEREAAKMEKEKATQARIDSEILVAVSNSRDAHAAALLIDRSKIALSEDGSVTGIEDAVKALQTAKPYLWEGKPPIPPTPGGGTPRGAGQPDTSLSGRIKAQADRSGRLGGIHPGATPSQIPPQGTRPG